MHVFLTTVGSRGDIQPFVALGKGLAAAGHRVTVNASEAFEPFITEHGLEYAYLGNDVVDLIESPAGRAAIEDTTNALAALRTYAKLIRQVGPMWRRMVGQAWTAARQAQPDLIVYHAKAFWGPHFAHALGAPAAMVMLAPLMVPTAAWTNIGFPRLGEPGGRLGARYRRASFRAVMGLSRLGTERFMRDWRTARGLPARSRRRSVLHDLDGKPVPVLHAHSRHVVPHPPDWPPEAHTTGFWLLDGPPDWQPPEALDTFLDAGPPPVYIGFGSMAGRDPQRRTRLVLEAVQRAGVRALLAKGWGGIDLGALPDGVFAIEQAPHDRLFPRVAAVVHHGGAGSTAAGLRAGRPTVVCPFFGDQPFWGGRVAALGVGPDPIPQKQLTAEKLAAALRTATTDAPMREQADVLGAAIRAEDGVAEAVRLLEAAGGER